MHYSWNTTICGKAFWLSFIFAFSCTNSTNASVQCNQSYVSTLPWGMAECTKHSFAVSAITCALACLSNKSCMGSNFHTNSSTPWASTSCKLCLHGNMIGPLTGSGSRAISFLMPYEHSSEARATHLTAPSGDFTSILLLVTATPTESFALSLTESTCPSAYANDCVVDFFFSVTLDESDQLLFHKFDGESWVGPGEVRGNGGVFKIGQAFQLLILVLANDYVVIANGVELIRYPLVYALVPSFKMFTTKLDPQFLRIVMHSLSKD
ncbi:hypothetical protein PoB_001256600 [Plakobranchus ocellatus]|uniref:Galectin n=1 Tax=Plakobranchus ocellatus TaxID=259542 RepID=A0AAV3YFG8_9GAST|nr:hypothetical protein PoB_001256600 [Plakobranchus ocellatus]